MEARIAGISKDSIVDGPGLRHAVFFQGCPHRCTGCHNPHTWDLDGGKFMDVESIAMDAINDPLCSGITLTGGEPLMWKCQASIIAEICKEAGMSVWLYTGFTFENVCYHPLFRYVDVCVDGLFIEKLKSYDLKWKGSSNQRVIDVKKWRETGKVEEWKPKE